jgi:cytochrome c553
MRQALAILMLLTATTASAQDAEGLAFFEKKIRPVLVQHCYKCHAADAKNIRGGLLLDTRSATHKGGDSGPAVVPGKPDESLLLGSIKYDDYEMPPSGKLPDSVIADFEKWISMGAPDPRDGQTTAHANGIDMKKGRAFWAFQKPKPHPVPKPKDTAWPKNNIDRFTLAAMDQAGLVPANDADKRTLLRRIYFDLIGLPPPPAAIDAFLQDESDHAFETVVDELLSSRHFGERWGRHWLDVARYSDSTGGGRSLLFKVAWRYRNYVIDAFNRDTPFDEFIKEQIAGDLLNSNDSLHRARQLTATGFLALGPTNYENQDKRQLRMDVVDEQIDTIGRAFLGMTIGCARCHDHKFDPIPTTDYYALAGIFRSTKSLVDGNVSNWITRRLPSTEPAGKVAAENVEALTATLKKRKQVLNALLQQLPATTIDDDKAELIGAWTDSTFVKGFVGKRYIHTTDKTAKAVYNFDVRNHGTHDLLISYTEGTNRDASTPITVLRNETELKTVRIDQRQAPAQQFVSLGAFEFEPGDTATVTIHTSGTTAVVIADAVRLTLSGKENPEVARLQSQIKAARRDVASVEVKLKKKQKALAATAQVLSVEEEKKPADFHVAIRGNVRNLGAKVPRGFLSVASQAPASIPNGASGRLEFANWIASPTNPLTAKVAVNRVWHHLFGSGLVRTVDNFGKPGERPSNPELLDHLALQFVDGGWSMKKLIRSIVLSRTYQLSTAATDKQTTTDPENRLFSHQNLRRLQAETLRDSVYSLSGKLNLEPVSDSVRKGTKSGYGYKFTSDHRSVYLPVFRNRLHPMFTVFDFPDPNLSIGRRNVSTLSTQALYLMNSPLILEHATATAKQLLSNKLNDHERLELLYEKALGRLPTSSETELALSFIKDGDSQEQIEQWAVVCQAVMGSVDFRYVR